jgi:ribonuclease Z
MLGTASQVPTRERNHVGFVLRWDAEAFLFDPGEATQQQLTRAGISANDLHHICLTHLHGDHCLGLPGVLARFSLDRVRHPVELHYPASGGVYVERLRHAAVYDDRADVRQRPVHDDGVLVDTGRWTLSARRLDHSIEAYGYRLEEPDGITFLPDRLRDAGVEGPAVHELAEAGEVRVGGRTVRLDEVSEPRRGQAVAVVLDTRVCDAALELARGVDLLVAESTFLDHEADLADRYRHLTARQAATLAREAGARRLVLTHYSQRHPDTSAFGREAAAVHDDVVAARDLDVVEVPHRVRHRR